MLPLMVANRKHLQLFIQTPPKTVAENWVSKQSWFTLALELILFLGLKLLFLKNESWNFQHLLEIST